MREATVKVLSFDELSDEAKERAHQDWLGKGLPHNWAREARKTIEAFENEFGVKVEDWWYDSSGYSFNLDTGNIDDDVLALKGNRARAWFWNHHGGCLLSPNVRYFTHVDGKRVEAIGVDNIKYRSNVNFDRVYDGTCPWTGVCFDCNALDPIAYFCFGVEWDDKEKKRVQAMSSRKLAIDNRNTVESLLNDALHSLFKALEEDCEYQDSIEAFKETCEANNYEFTEDGEMWSGMKEV